MDVSQKTKVARLEAQRAAAEAALAALACALPDDELTALLAYWWLEDSAFLHDYSLKEGGVEEYDVSVSQFREICSDPERHFSLYASANLTLWERLTSRQRAFLGWPKTLGRTAGELREVGEAWPAWHAAALARRLEGLEQERRAIVEAWAVERAGLADFGRQWQTSGN